MNGVLEAINDGIVALMDGVLGWSLALPRDVALLILAALTCTVLLVVTRLTTDQAFLRQCDRDRRRLKQLLRDARRAKDKEAVQRYRMTLGQIGMCSFRAQGKPLLASLLPIILLASWAFARLAYLPPRPDEPLLVTGRFPMATAGSLAHIVPQEGLAAEDGWACRIEADDDPSAAAPGGRATWRIRGKRRAEPYALVVRHGEASLEAPLLIDGRRCSPPHIPGDDAGGILAVDVGLPVYRPFGVIPGWPAAGLDPWVIGYLLLAAPLTMIAKRVLGIA